MEFLTLVGAFVMLVACMILLEAMFMAVLTFVAFLIDAVFTVPILVFTGGWWLIRWAFHNLRRKRDAKHKNAV